MYMKRVEIEKVFPTEDMARGFVEGIQFIGIREFQVKEVKEKAEEFVVVLEKLERGKT